MDPAQGNEILRIIHERRVTGSLGDRGIKIDHVNVPRSSLTRALRWLRENHPVDEQSAAARWAAKELDKFEGGYIGRAERLGLIDRASADFMSRSTTNTRTSVIDQLKEHNRQKEVREAQERRRSGEEKRSQDMQLAKTAKEEEDRKARK